MRDILNFRREFFLWAWLQTTIVSVNNPHIMDHKLLSKVMETIVFIFPANNFLILTSVTSIIFTAFQATVCILHHKNTVIFFFLAKYLPLLTFFNLRRLTSANKCSAKRKSLVLSTFVLPKLEIMVAPMLRIIPQTSSNSAIDSLCEKFYNKTIPKLKLNEADFYAWRNSSIRAAASFINKGTDNK